jgi:hypothetical protein
MWLKCLVLHSCPRVDFPSTFTRHITSVNGENKKNFKFILALTKYYYVTINFDFWMSKGAYDVFALVINFFGSA